jgi:hypothetical protein
MSKKNLGLALPEEVIALADRNIKAADCRSRSEFVEAAIRFYAEYLSLDDSRTIVPLHLQNAIKHAVDLAENRMSKVLFKNAVSVQMLSELILRLWEYGEGELEKIEQTAFDEVCKYNGMLDTEQTMRRLKRY